MTLSSLLGRNLTLEWQAHKRKLSGLKSPKRVGLTVFHRLATAPDVLRFAFVRNPYARLVSCWLNKFCEVPLILTKPSVDSYLAWRQKNDLSLPEGHTSTLSFGEFINFVTMTAHDRVDAHWYLQSGLLDMPGIDLNLIGKVSHLIKISCVCLTMCKRTTHYAPTRSNRLTSLTMSIGETFTRTNSPIVFTKHTSSISTGFNILANCHRIRRCVTYVRGEEFWLMFVLAHGYVHATAPFITRLD